MLELTITKQALDIVPLDYSSLFVTSERLDCKINND